MLFGLFWMSERVKGSRFSGSKDGWSAFMHWFNWGDFQASYSAHFDFLASYRALMVRFFEVLLHLLMIGDCLVLFFGHIPTSSYLWLYYKQPELKMEGASTPTVQRFWKEKSYGGEIWRACWPICGG